MEIVTIDLGTSLCKVQLFREDGTELSRYSEEIKTSHPQPSWSEQNPEDWWRAVKKGFRHCLEACGSEAQVEAIGLCSHRESVVPVDERGIPLHSCILWSDRRCSKEARELSEVFGRELHQRTGMKPDPYFSAPKILWLKRNKPEVVDRSYKFLLPKDYLVWRLTGEFSTDWSVASRTMLLDIRKRTWWGELVRYVGIDLDQLCQPKRSDAVVGETMTEVCRELGLAEEALVVAGAGDRQCEACAAGIGEERAMESTGSATNVSVASHSLPSSLVENLLYSLHADGEMFLVEQGIGTTGLSLRWFKDSFWPPHNGEDFEREPYRFIDREAADSGPGANGLIFLPFLSGAQAARWNPSAKGILFGLSLGHGYGDVARAIMEGIACEIRACLEVLEGGGISPTEIIALGGASRSELWNQIKADITSRVYWRPRVPEAASLGAMLIASRGCGLELSAEDINPVVSAWKPNPRVKETYDRVYQTYNMLYEANLGMFRLSA